MTHKKTAEKQDCVVVVVGAGLSGLQAAQSLRNHCSDIIVVEASEYIGGRVRQVESALVISVLIQLAILPKCHSLLLCYRDPVSLNAGGARCGLARATWPRIRTWRQVFPEGVLDSLATSCPVVEAYTLGVTLRPSM